MKVEDLLEKWRIICIELEGIPEDIKNWIHSEKDNGVEVITYNLDVGYKSYGLGK